MKSIMGLFDASLGAKSNETSGRAIMARQREGDVGRSTTSTTSPAPSATPAASCST
jgi:hypothetical protein